MRLLIVLFSLLLVPVFALVLEWRFENVQRPQLEEQCRLLLDKADLRAVTVSLDHFHARLTGLGRQPNDRDTAAQIVRSIRGVQLLDEDNRVVVPAQLTAKFADDRLQIEGWVDTEKSRREVMLLVARFRPEMLVSADDVRLSRHVVMGPEAEIDGFKTTPKVAELLNSIRPPSALSVTNDAGVFRLRGYLPSEKLRSDSIAAIQAKPWEWKVEASKLYANTHAVPASFTQGDALAAFLRRFFDTPSPGEFSIDARKGPHMKAYATPSMEADWRRLLLPLSGAARVQAEITLLPSLMHFPGFRPQSQIEEDLLQRLRAVFKMQTIHFDKSSSRLLPSEQVKLGPLVFLINAAGPDARFIVAGYDEPGGEPGGGGGRLRAARAETVRTALAQMGVRKEVLEAQGFDAVRSPGVISEEVRRESRRVELLVK
jgi:outer membrane protein OmpA-like peptidoglycan-associated protein